MAKPIILSADCTCDLGPELKERYRVHYYPCPVVFQGKAYPDDGQVVTTEMVYEDYYKNKRLPTTSAATVRQSRNSSAAAGSKNIHLA